MTKNKGETEDKTILDLYPIRSPLQYIQDMRCYETDCRLRDEPGREVQTILDSLYGLL